MTYISFYKVILRACLRSDSPQNQTEEFMACRLEAPVYIFPGTVWQWVVRKLVKILYRNLFSMLHFVFMAETGAETAKRTKKAKGDGDKARAKTRVNLGWSFNRWRALRWKDSKLILNWSSSTQRGVYYACLCIKHISIRTNCCLPLASTTNAPASQIKIYNKRRRCSWEIFILGNTTAFVQRSCPNQHEMKVPCSCFNLCFNQITTQWTWGHEIFQHSGTYTESGRNGGFIKARGPVAG